MTHWIADSLSKEIKSFWLDIACIGGDHEIKGTGSKLERYAPHSLACWVEEPHESIEFDRKPSHRCSMFLLSLLRRLHLARSACCCWYPHNPLGDSHLTIAELGWLNLGWLVLDLAIVIVLIPTILLQRRESGATLAWIMVILLVPFLGLLAFWLFGTTRLHLRRRRRRRIESRLAPELQRLQTQPVSKSIPEEIPHSLLHLAENLDGMGPQPGNRVVLLRHGASVFDALESALDQARHHVHLVYYIWEPDATGVRMRDALVRAAARGVQVRLLLDDVGSRRARHSFFSPLTLQGGSVERFLPVNPLNRQLTLNNRNHRKIVVVDGLVGFTGGMNVGDIYAGLADSWLDLHARLEGPVIQSLQETFCQDWYHATGEDLVNTDYFPQVADAGTVWAQLLTSGPADERWRAIHTFMFAAINLAQKQVWIETPYFVPDPPILMALQTAALRGVDVRILLPNDPDHKLVYLASFSYLQRTESAGVKIYRYLPGFMHQKVVLVDKEYSAIGTANLDNRSFRLNFEIMMLFEDPEINRQVATMLEKDFKNSRIVPATDYTDQDFLFRLGVQVSRLTAPVL